MFTVVTSEHTRRHRAIFALPSSSNVTSHAHAVSTPRIPQRPAILVPRCLQFLRHPCLGQPHRHIKRLFDTPDATHISMGYISFNSKRSRSQHVLGGSCRLLVTACSLTARHRHIAPHYGRFSRYLQRSGETDGMGVA